MVLNANARSVTDRVVRDVTAAARDRCDVYLSRSLEHSGFIAHQIAHRGYDAVLCGGGDGTFVQVATDLAALRPPVMPALGVLRLGTGNALASVLGAARADADGIAADLARAGDARAEIDLDLLAVGGRLAPFAGVGLDSLILSDYNAVKRSVADTPLSGLMQGGAGYAAAIATRSFWRFTLGSLPMVEIRNAGEPAEPVDLAGRVIDAPVAAGGLLYRGPAAIAAVSTIPVYGLELRLFPQVERRTGRFQLRVGKVGAVNALLRLNQLFRGTYQHPRLFDFMCTAIDIRVARPTAFQIGGDEVAARDALHVGLSRVRAIRGTRLPVADAPAYRPARRAVA